MVVLGAEIWHKYCETNPTALHRHNFQGPWYIFCANPLKTVLELLCFFRHILSISHKLQHRKQTMIVPILAVPPHSIQVFTNVTRGFCLESVFHWFLFATHAVPHFHHVCSHVFCTSNSELQQTSYFFSVLAPCLSALLVCEECDQTRYIWKEHSVSYGPGDSEHSEKEGRTYHAIDYSKQALNRQPDCS